MVAHAHIQDDNVTTPIVLFKRSVLLYGTGKLYSKYGEDRSKSDVTILSTDAGQTDVYVISYSVQCNARCVLDELVTTSRTKNSDLEHKVLENIIAGITAVCNLF